MALLEVQDLHVRLHTRAAGQWLVRGASLSLERAQTLGLIRRVRLRQITHGAGALGLLPAGAQVSGSIRLTDKSCWAKATARLGASVAAASA